MPKYTHAAYLDEAIESIKLAKVAEGYILDTQSILHERLEGLKKLKLSRHEQTIKNVINAGLVVVDSVKFYFVARSTGMSMGTVLAGLKTVRDGYDAITPLKKLYRTHKDVMRQLQLIEKALEGLRVNLEALRLLKDRHAKYLRLQ